MSFKYSYAEQLGALCSPVKAQPIHGVKLQLLNTELAEELAMPEWFYQEEQLLSQIFEHDGILAKNSVAQKYGGHQFGHWNPDIGDGRGLLLAEKQTNNGDFVDLHLKGAGKTPYSRFGDGRAVLRSTLREYLASEALHYLGIPSSRSLCLMSSTHPVQREEMEYAAAMIRTAPSHLRFGHFEYFFHTKQKDKLQSLFDFTFKHHFPHCLNSDNPYGAVLSEIVASTAKLVAKWQVFGFCHGVMNSDNMSIHGITFDYGPYGFMDNFQSGFVCNHSDTGGRYAYDQQAGVALWDLNALAYGFSDHLDKEQITEILAEYEGILLSQYSLLMADKFGLMELNTTDPNTTDPNTAATNTADHHLINDYMQQMEKEGRDFSNSFRLLGTIRVKGENQAIRHHFIDQDFIAAWLQSYCQRLTLQAETDEVRNKRVNLVNPKYILRNYLAQEAIEAAESGDFGFAQTLLDVLKNPYDEQPEFNHLAKGAPASAQGIALSCSS